MSFPFLFELENSQYFVVDLKYLKVKLPREYIKLSPISNAIIPHKSSAMKKFGVLY
jgi:hypothetical protein